MTLWFKFLLEYKIFIKVYLQHPHPIQDSLIHKGTKVNAHVSRQHMNKKTPMFVLSLKTERMRLPSMYV